MPDQLLWDGTFDFVELANPNIPTRQNHDEELEPIVVGATIGGSGSADRFVLSDDEES